jgi:protein-disulfide isomerase
MKVSLIAAFLAGVAIVMTAVPGSTPAQETDAALRSLMQAVEALKESQARIQQELEEIKALLRGRPSAGLPDSPSATFKLTDEPTKGDRNAKLVLIEFTDYQCPFCARHARETMPQLDTEYIATGKLRYVVVDFPLASIHPAAPKAAEAGHCAGEQGKYWEMHDRLFANHRNLAPADLAGHAQALALDPGKFKECLDSGRHGARVQNGLAAGQNVGVRATPTFLLGIVEADGSTVKTVQIIRGAQPLPTFRSAIDKALNRRAGARLDRGHGPPDRAPTVEGEAATMANEVRTTLEPSFVRQGWIAAR